MLRPQLLLQLHLLLLLQFQDQLRLLHLLLLSLRHSNLLFQKLKKLQEEAGAQKSSKLNQLFSTHPDLDARIQRMEERATSEGIEKPAVAE